jgi:hypothetical protein
LLFAKRFYTHAIVTGLAAAVLGFSNKYAVEDWEKFRPNYQPQVWVAACSVLSNALLAFAFAEGVSIYFWTRATAGTTVSVELSLSINVRLGAKLRLLIVPTPSCLPRISSPARCAEGNC